MIAAVLITSTLMSLLLMTFAALDLTRAWRSLWSQL